MKIQLRYIFFSISVFFNLIVVFIIILSSSSKSSNFYYYSPDENSITAAAVVNFPSDGKAVIELIEITMKPGQKAYIQFSIIPENKKQGNVLISPLYDPDIISISNTAFGIEITGVNEGVTLMQTLLNDGIKNIALINIER